MLKPSEQEVYEVSDALQKLSIAANRVSNSLCWNADMRRRVDQVQVLVMELREKLAQAAK